MKLLIQKNYLFLLPILPLIDFLTIKSIPLCTIIGYAYICIQQIIKCKKINVTMFLFSLSYIFSICYASIINNMKIEYFMVFLTVFTFFILANNMGTDVENNMQSLVYFVYCYFILNTFIYVWRISQYGFDFNRLRSGISIYGGNTAHFVYLLVLFLLKKYNLKNMKKAYNRVLIILVANAILYISKGAIIITAFWIFLDVISRKKTKKISIKNIFIVLLIILLLPFVIPKIVKSDFLQYLNSRFQIWFDLYENTGSFMGTRGKIYDSSIEYLMNNPISLLTGIGNTNFKNINIWGYSNVHNVFLDIIFDTGVIGLILFIKIISYIILNNKKNRLYFLLCIIYATIEGISMLTINMSDCIMVAYGLFFIFICFQDCAQKIES